jgi:hypothetical protein
MKIPTNCDAHHILLPGDVTLGWARRAWGDPRAPQTPGVASKYARPDISPRFGGVFSVTRDRRWLSSLVLKGPGLAPETAFM